MHRIEIERLSNGGDGIGHLADGRVVFVPLSAPGDIIDVTLFEEKPNFTKARIEEIVTPSSLRVEPPCPYFGACGGCQWQHISREAQTHSKTESVRDSLQRIAHIHTDDDLIAPCAAPSEAYGYRNKIELRVDTSGPRMELGLTRRDTDDIVPIEECLLMPERSRNLLASVRGALRFIMGREEISIDRVALRTAHNSRDTQIALWTPPSSFPRALAGKTLEQATGAGSVVRVIHDGSTSKRAVKNVERLAGKAWWSERLGGYRLSASAPSFFQVNTVAAETLIEKAISAADPEETDLVIDLYAGGGTFTLPLAERAHVIAIESSRWSLGDLRNNLDRSNLSAEVIGGDASYALKEIFSCDIALVDPPRAGLAEEVITDLTALGPRRIVYVSCDGATFARDASRFLERGYRLGSVEPIDLFPNTYHTEIVATLVPE